MKITVEIPTALRRFTDGVQTIECSSETLPALLGEIEQRFPAISKHLRDDSGQVRRFVNIYVNEEDIRFLGGNNYKFREGDRVLVVPSIAGGAPSRLRRLPRTTAGKRAEAGFWRRRAVDACG
jgi:sulfur-carrier protein